MSQQGHSGKESLLDILKATVRDAHNQKQRFEKELSDLRVEQDAARVMLTKLCGNVPTPKGTILGNIGKLFGAGGSSNRIEEFRDIVTTTSARAEMVRGLIQDQEHRQEKAIDEYLLATDECYRTDSMRWNAVMRLRHSLELYTKAVADSLRGVQSAIHTESIRKSQGMTSMSEQELLSRGDIEKSLLSVKAQRDTVITAASDVVTHDAKAACRITITYHGGVMTFDFYARPDNLCLYQVDTIEDIIRQLEGLGRAVRAASSHVETMSNRAIAERLRYWNRVQKLLHHL